MKKAIIQLETLVCPSCSAKIDAAVKNLDGVDKDSVNMLFVTSKLKLDFDSEKVSIDKIKETIEKVGFEVLKTKVKDI